jgi:hypothetical protein
MRVLFGIILGVALTVGAAFISDTWSTGAATTTGSGTTLEHRTIVNWNVVGDNMRIVRRRAHETWTALTRKVSS